MTSISLQFRQTYVANIPTTQLKGESFCQENPKLILTCVGLPE